MLMIYDMIKHVFFFLYLSQTLIQSCTIGSWKSYILCTEYQTRKFETTRKWSTNFYFAIMCPEFDDESFLHSCVTNERFLFVQTYPFLRSTEAAVEVFFQFCSLYLESPQAVFLIDDEWHFNEPSERCLNIIWKKKFFRNRLFWVKTILPWFQFSDETFSLVSCSTFKIQKAQENN